MIVIESITLRWLKKERACKEAIKIFKKKFGRKATIKQIVDYLHEINKPDWEEWLMTREPELTITMVNNGADIHAGDDFALSWVKRYNSPKIVEFLQNIG